MPLRVRGESIGLLALVRFEASSPPFTESDRSLAQALVPLGTLGRAGGDHERIEAAVQDPTLIA